MKYFVADETYNEELCRLSREIGIPGRIELAYTRDPDFFQGLRVQGKFNQVISGSFQGSLVGMGCRSIKSVYINGKPFNIGYLSGLKIAEEYRQKTSLLKGFKIFRELHEDKKAPAYLTTIVEDNDRAKKILTGKFKGLPKYHDFGQYLTHSIFMNKRKTYRSNHPSIEVLTGDQFDMDNIIEFINTEGKKRQFFPVYQASDFNSDYTRDFLQKDFYIAVKGDQIQGIAGKWDQSRYKQILVRKYKRPLRYLRCLLNFVLFLRGYSLLPGINRKFRMFFISFVCVRDNNVEILETLLKKIYMDNQDNGYHYFMIGFHEDDMLKNAVKPFYSICYESRLYIVSPYKDSIFINNLDRTLTPYLEIASL